MEKAQQRGGATVKKCITEHYLVSSPAKRQVYIYKESCVARRYQGSSYESYTSQKHLRKFKRFGSYTATIFSDRRKCSTAGQVRMKMKIKALFGVSGLPENLNSHHLVSWALLTGKALVSLPVVLNTILD